MKINRGLCFVSALLCVLSCGRTMGGAAGSESVSDTTKVDAVVTVDVNNVLEENFLGVGAQFSPYDAYPITTSDFQLVCQRLDHMRLPLTRVMLMAHWYCKGLDDAGEPIYDWDSPLMKLLCNNLDWCQANNVNVMIGEWGAPPGRIGVGLRDPGWARLVADSVEHLLDTKGYTCIKYYNLINEPHGSWSSVRGDWNLWCSVITNLHREFVERGLDKRIGIAVADAGEEWTLKALNDDRLKPLAGIYEEHWYTMNKSVMSGDIEISTRKRVAAIREKDPGKSFIVGEFGLQDELDYVHDQQRHVFDFWYGVSMTDFVVQFIRGGGAGVIAWVLDDAMHQKASRQFRKPDDDPYEWRKIWGFWDIIAEARGHPGDRHLRPWFYTWSMMGNYFPSGSQTIVATPSGLDGVRVAAAKIAAGDKWHLSMVAVNNSEQERTIRLVVAAASGQAVTLSKFEYSDRDGDNRVDAWPEVVDADGNDIYPAPTETLTGVDLSEGLVVSLPANSALCVTTIKGGTTMRLGVRR